MSVSASAPTPFYQDPDRMWPTPSATDAGNGAAADAATKHLSMFGEGDDSPSFWDVLDIVNPLQHIPVLSDLYREATGDKIGVGARLLGGMLFGGPIGVGLAAADCVVEESTGKDSGEHVLAMFRDEGSSSPETAVAKESSPASSQSSAAATAAPSSPAKATVEVGPVIQIPASATGATGAATGQPMVFSLDDLQKAAGNGLQGSEQPKGGQSGAAANNTSTPPAAPVALTPANANSQAAAMAAKMRPINRGDSGHFMPVPARNASATGDNQPAALSVPVSNSSARSNVPISGRNPRAERVPVTSTPLAAQETTTNGAVASNGPSGGDPDWFVTAWNQALDKYQQANDRNGKSTRAATSDAAQ